MADKASILEIIGEKATSIRRGVSGISCLDKIK
jgi:hypothetical protein